MGLPFIEGRLQRGNNHGYRLETFARIQVQQFPMHSPIGGSLVSDPIEKFPQKIIFLDLIRAPAVPSHGRMSRVQVKTAACPVGGPLFLDKNVRRQTLRIASIGGR